MPSESPMPGKCGAKCRNGGFCTQSKIFDRCRMHSGKTVERAKAQARVRDEVRRWGLGDATVDPAEIMLRLVSQSAQRVQFLSNALAEAYDAADRLRAAYEAEEITLAEPVTRIVFERDEAVERPEHAAKQTARNDLDQIFSQGGLAALVGHTYAATKDGDIYAAGEAIRGLAKLEAEERDRCAGFAAKAIAAGLAERTVRVAERQGLEMAGVFRRVLAGVGLTAEQMAAVPALLAREIAAITGRNVLDGGVL